MANVCTNYLTIKGDSAVLDKLQERIRIQDADLLKLFMWFEKNQAYGMYGEPYRGAPDVLTLPFTSKWRPPTDELEDLSKELGLHISCVYEEPGMIFYGRVSFDAGEMSEDVSFDEESYLEDHDEDFKISKQDIQECSYEEFLEGYIQGFDWMEAEGGDPRWCILEKYIVERIKDEDLALFINTEWQHKEAEKMYRERLTGEKESKR